MRKQLIEIDSIKRCFNSKRCDYERAVFRHGALHNVSFNSKRCDYEQLNLEVKLLTTKFQFQKVRL